MKLPGTFSSIILPVLLIVAFVPTANSQVLADVYIKSLLSADTNRPCSFVKFQDASGNEINLENGQPWAAIPMSNPGHDTAFTLLLTAMTTDKKLWSSTTGTYLSACDNLPELKNIELTD